MKSRSITVLVWIVVCLSIVAAGCISNPVTDKEPIRTPDEPPDGPPPPPPPPPQGSMCLTGYELSLKGLAESVLRGDFGLELQTLLATEISVCLNRMQEEGMVSINFDDTFPNIEVISDRESYILYDYGYLIHAILDGEFGETARSNLHLFIRSFEN